MKLFHWKKILKRTGIQTILGILGMGIILGSSEIAPNIREMAKLWLSTSIDIKWVTTEMGKITNTSMENGVERID